VRVDWASHKATSFACQNWHYSKTVPIPPLVKIGVWEEDKFVGVVVFSRGASSNLLKPYGLKQTEGCELSRVALRKHKTPVSKIVKIALRFLKQHDPTVRLVVSFADPHRGHHGGIYQAGNWVYAGATAPGKEYLHRGKKLHSRQVSEKGWKIQHGVKWKTAKPSECEVVETPGKHRYLMPLDKEIAERIAPLAKPYPKRGKQAMAPPRAQRQGSADLHAPALEESGENFPSNKADEDKAVV